MNRVALHIANHVFGIVEQILLHIGFSQPGTGLTIDGGLGAIDTAHVGEGRSGFFKISFVKLRAAHEQPGLPEKRVVLSAIEPLDVAGGFPPVLVPYGPTANTVLMDSLLGFLYGSVVVAFAQFATGFIANRVERNDFCEIVAVSFFLLKRSIHIGHCTVVIGVVARIEGVPPAGLGRIFLCGATCQEQQGTDDEQRSHGALGVVDDGECFIFQGIGQCDASQCETAEPLFHLGRAHGVEHIGKFLLFLVGIFFGIPAGKAIEFLVVEIFDLSRCGFHHAGLLAAVVLAGTGGAIAFRLDGHIGTAAQMGNPSEQCGKKSQQQECN